jgi:hypothetical protein
MSETDKPRAAFRPRLGALAAIVGLLAGYFYEMNWADAVVGAGVGFIVGGVLPLLAGIWQYLLVFFAATGGFVWFLIHYLT